MKPLRFLLQNSAFVLFCFSTFSCIDNSYDLSDLSGKAQLLRNSLSAPVGTLTIHMDSIIGEMDVSDTILKLNNDGIYTFQYKGNFDLKGISKTINTFQLPSIDDIQSPIDLYDASGSPVKSFPLPKAESKSYSFYMNISLPSSFFSTSLIDIDSVSLVDTYIRLSAECVGLEGGNGKTLADNMSITFTPVKDTNAAGKFVDAADYYIKNKKTDKWEDTTSWKLGPGEIDTIKIGKIRLTDSKKLSIRGDVQISVENLGDVIVTDNAMSYITFKIKFFNGIDFDRIFGQVNYTLPKTQITPINFDGLGKILNENDVLSIYNPTIILNTEGNIGVPVDLTLDMSTSNSKTGVSSPALTNATIRIPNASNYPDLTESTDTIDKDNGTSELFKINPDIINLGYEAHTVKNKNEHYFIAKSSQLSLNYAMEIPLQFGNDLRLSIDTTLENPFADNLDILDDQDSLSVGLFLNVKNRIPLAMEIELEALDENYNSLFTVQTGTINAAKVDDSGLATDTTATNVEILLGSDEINQLKDTKMFRVTFIVSSSQSAKSVSVKPSDYITLTIGGKINGGILLDFKSKK